jgi:ferredoxin
VKVKVDAAACQGHGRCYALAPDIFEADDHGHCVIPQADVPAGREDAARAGAENCPEDAITVEES